MKLIYHKIDEEYSPFDEELVKLSKDENLLLVSPYIGLSYLKRLISLSKSWKLISDFKEWIISHPNERRRLEIRDFIVKNSDKIRHIPDIHAKVMITKNNGFLGSANFTKYGITKRTEMSISFEDQYKVDELKNWFQLLWDNAEEFTEKEITDFVIKNRNVNPKPYIKEIRRGSKYKKIESLLVPINEQPAIKKDYEQKLVKAIQKSKQTKEYINRYLNLIKEILEEFNIEENSPKITMSANSGITITIGQRYVIELKGNKISMILPLEFRDLVSDYHGAEIDEDYFYRNRVQQALWVKFDSRIIFSIDKDEVLFENWKKAIKAEIDRTKYSGFKRSHNPCYYRAVIDLEYRKIILNKLTI